MKIEGPNNATLGSLSNDDGDGNEDGKKAITVYKKNNNHARAQSRFFLHFLAVVPVARQQGVTFRRGRAHSTATFFFFS